MKNGTAKYKVIQDSEGKLHLNFYCDLSGALEYTYTSDRKDIIFTENDIMEIWKKEAKANFNECRKCGKFVCSEMYNAEVFECVSCAPWESAPKYCPHCGKKVKGAVNKCGSCGGILRYEGGDE